MHREIKSDRDFPTGNPARNIPLSSVSEEGELKCKHREGRRILNQSFINRRERERDGKEIWVGKE